MAEYLSPGVYVEEFDSAPRAIEGVGTSTAGFVGFAEKGPTSGAPVLITSYAEYIRVFGGYLGEHVYGGNRFLPYAVEQFFINGGTRCYVSRVAPEGAAAATVTTGAIRVTAANEGKWGNKVTINFKDVSSFKAQMLEQVSDTEYVAKSLSGFEEGNLVVFNGEYNKILSVNGDHVVFERAFAENPVDTDLIPKKFVYSAEVDVTVSCGGEGEVYTGVCLNPESSDFIVRKMAKSALVRFECQEIFGIGSPTELLTGEEGKGVVTITLSGGTEGEVKNVTPDVFIGKDLGPGKRTGIMSFLENDVVSIMAVPGITLPEVVVSLVTFCERKKSCFAVLDIPMDLVKTNEILEYRELIDSTYAAMYHPWIQIFDQQAKKPAFIPPSGSVAGVYSRTDIVRGVHKAPANETIMTSGLSTNFNTGEQDILNPKGVNLIRALPGQGIKIWGARTASSNSNFKYVNVRRLFIFVEESIRANTNWVVFEPNDAGLWDRVRMTIEGFLGGLWRAGMLVGATEAEAFYVDIGPNTMTRDDIENGRLICQIGIAPSKPAEFVIFRITQHTAQ
ncbi:MAG: phage tail sheath subtilisin-like domain-containing protein [Clostridia bacterium]|nr:phage tail sheath subtilisin-like domain-containing protein [Clostridia bacterium]